MIVNLQIAMDDIWKPLVPVISIAATKRTGRKPWHLSTADWSVGHLYSGGIRLQWYDGLIGRPADFLAVF